MNRTSSLLIVGMTLMVASAIFSVHQTAVAGPVSGGVGNWPYVKLGIYQGVAALSVNGTSVMELGANGKDIATSTTSPIVIRANSVPVGNAAIVTSSSGASRLKVPGRVCLFPNGISQPAVCNSSWPSGTSTLWSTSTAASDGFITLSPIAAQGISLGSSTTPVTGGTALSITQDDFADIFALRTANMQSSNPALSLTGTTQISGQLTIFGTWTINGSEVFHGPGRFNNSSIAAHDGALSGLDADKLDGYNVTLENGNHCNSVVCLCFAFGGSTGTRCAAMQNRF